MFDYQSTSRFRRKVKRKFVQIKKKIQRELSKSLTNLADIDLKKSSKKEKSKSTTDLRLDSSNQSEKFSEQNSHSEQAIDKENGTKDSNNIPFVKEMNSLTTNLKQQGRKFTEYVQKKCQDIDEDTKPFRQWKSVVTVALIEGRNFSPSKPERSNFYVKFRSGNEIYKSKIISKVLSPRWLEQFNFHIYDDDDGDLEITLWDKDKGNETLLGSLYLDLDGLEVDKTYDIWQEFHDEIGSLHFLLTISGISVPDAFSEVSDDNESCDSLLDDYTWHKTFQNYKDVGQVTVRVIKAAGLAPADMKGNSNPSCVLELGNSRVQTQTELKTLTPCWNRVFTFQVTDINDVLDVMVFDEYRDYSMEFLGRVVVPLLNVQNGEKKWYALKDKRLRQRANGHFPQILLEIDIRWNPIRACITSLNQKEEKYFQHKVKIKTQILTRNVGRLKKLISAFVEHGKIMRNLLDTDSKLLNFGLLIFWLILCKIFQLWMIPAAGVGVFVSGYIGYLDKYKPIVHDESVADFNTNNKLGQEQPIVVEKEEKKGVIDRIQTMPEVTQTVQNAIGNIASFMERIKNIANFSVPYVSFIALILLLITTIVMFLIPVRILFMLYGINRFLRKTLGYEDAVNMDIFALLSRVPDDEMLIDYEEIGPIIDDTVRQNWQSNRKNRTAWYVSTSSVQI